MTGVIELRGLRVEAVVGVGSDERKRVQPLSLDLDLERSFVEAATTDDITATTNYADILSLACRVAVEGHFYLLETLAVRVGEAILGAHPAISSVSVTVRKLVPPVPEEVESVGVHVTLTQSP